MRDDVTHLGVGVAGVLLASTVDLMLNLTLVSNLGDLCSVDRGFVVKRSEGILDVAQRAFTFKTELPQHRRLWVQQQGRLIQTLLHFFTSLADTVSRRGGVILVDRQCLVYVGFDLIEELIDRPALVAELPEVRLFE